MGWWSSPSPSSSTADVTRMQDAQTAIASIFEPSNRSLAPATSAAEKRTSPPPPLQETAAPSPAVASPTTPTASGWRGLTEHVRAWLPQRSPSSKSNTEEVKSAASSSTSPLTPWEELPPSPLAGYTLTKRGLVDQLQVPPHTLTSVELRSLIHELTTVEQKAKYDMDAHFAEHLGSRGLHGLELLINPCLFCFGLYLMTWKTMHLYNGAVPQDSVLFTRLFALLQWWMPAGQRELLAQRHRRLMRATNARVALTFATGVAVSAVAYISRPARDVMENAPDMQTTKDMAAYQQHTAASVKWCWFVYYHHPAYRALTNP